MESSKQQFIYAQNSYLHQYIQFADTKSAVFITLNGIVMSFIYAQFKNFVPVNIKDSKQLVLIVCSILLLISYVFLLLVIFPRRNYKKGNGIIFWEDVSQNENEEAYKIKVNEIENNGFEDIMIEQNYYLSKTATKKYKNLHLSFIFSTWAYMLLVVYAILLFF